jgi:hypothetical protein
MIKIKDMKNIKFIILHFITITLLIACDKKLDIKPKQSVVADAILTTSDGIINLLHGAYSGIKGTYGTNEGGELYGGHFNFMSEELADDGDAGFIGTFQQHKDFFAKSMTTNHTYVLASWIRAYDVINMVNIVLDKLSIVDESEQQRVEGEALCIRGMIYFELVRFWGLQWDPAGANTQPGVPIRLTPTYSVEDAIFIPRSAVAQVYAQAISDLTEAETLLEPYGTNDVRVNTYTASAYLSRIYLQQSKFEEAALAANRVISSNLFTLVGRPIDAFNQMTNSTEDVFAIQQSTISNAGTSNSGLATHYASLNGQGRGDIIINDQHLARYEIGDLRGQVTSDLKETATFLNVKTMFYIGIGQNSGFTNILKWGDATKNIPLVRLSEMYLTRAEGNFEAGTTHGALPLDDINLIRNRAGLDPLTFVSQDTIRNERRLELAYEGFALHDIRRWHLNIGTLSYDDPRLVLPIPQREIDVNPEMEQNEWYIGN